MSITHDAMRAEALFVCDLQPSEHPTPEQVRRAVRGVLRQRSARWCAARMAQEYGDHPEAAAQRMAWARRVVADCFGPPLPVRPTRCRATGACARWVDTYPVPASVWFLRRAALRCACSPGRRRRSRS